MFKMLAKLSIFFIILLLCDLKMCFADAASSELNEIFVKLDALEKRVNTLESENRALKDDLKKQSKSFDDYKTEQSTKHDDFNRKDFEMQNDIKIIKFKTLPSLETEVSNLRKETTQNVTQLKVVLQDQDTKWTHNILFLNATLSQIDTDQSIRFAVLEDNISRKARFDDVLRLDGILNQTVEGLETLKTEVKTNYAVVVGKIDNDISDAKNSLILKMETLAEVDGKQTKDLQDLETSLTQLQRSVGRLNSITQDGIRPSFYALMSTSVSVTGPQQKMVYDTIRTNNGNAYNNFTGIFTVPETGTYVFTWTAFSYVEEYLRLEIVVAGTVYGGTLSDTQETGDADTETGIVVVNAVVGDEVFIRTQSIGPGNGRLYVEFESTSTFSGWKI